MHGERIGARSDRRRGRRQSREQLQAAQEKLLRRLAEELDPSRCSGVRVVVVRGWGDRRSIDVPVEALRRLHIAVEERGRRRWLRHPMLAAYMHPAHIAGRPFGHDGEHAEDRIVVLIRRADNEPGLYRRLRAEGEKHRYSRQFALDRRARSAQRHAERSGF